MLLQLSCDKKPEEFRTNSKWLAAELVMLMLLVGAAPAAGFTRVVYRFEKIQQTEQRLRAAEQRWASRRTRVRDRALGANYSDKSRTLLLQKSGFAADASAAPPPYYSYLNISYDRRPSAENSEKFDDLRPIRGAALLIGLLTWSVPGSSAGPGKVSLGADGTLRLELASSSLPALEAPYSEENLSSRNLTLGLSIMGAVIAAVYWATQRLTPTRVVRPPNFDQRQVCAVQAKEYEGIFVIGAPRMSKDQIVDETVRSVTGVAIHRIKLLDADLCTGLWVVAGRLISSSMIAGGLFFLLTQGFPVQSLISIVSGSGVIAIPLVRNLLARLSGRPASTEFA
jgi:hypothetical protein